MSPVDPAPADRTRQRARETAQWAEFNALMKRLAVLQPNFGCFCGSVDDLRALVARLERSRGRATTTTDRDVEQRREQLNRWHHDDTAGHCPSGRVLGDDDGAGP